MAIQSSQQLETHPLRGALFETWVMAELMKSHLNVGERPSLYFWRDSNGNEVDILVGQAACLMPVEIKSGVTVARDFFAGLEKWLALAGDLGVDPLLVYSGESSYQQKGVRVVGWQDLDTVGRWLDCG